MEVSANNDQPLVRLRMDNLTCLMRFLYLGNVHPVHICSDREPPLEEILDQLRCINGMVRPKRESYPYQVIKKVQCDLKIGNRNIVDLFFLILFRSCKVA